MHANACDAFKRHTQIQSAHANWISIFCATVRSFALTLHRVEEKEMTCLPGVSRLTFFLEKEREREREREREGGERERERDREREEKEKEKEKEKERERKKERKKEKKKEGKKERKR